MTKIINLFGGAGSGKSTYAAALFAELKMQGHNVELAQEEVKNWVYEKRPISKYSQIHILGSQAYREMCAYEKVDFLITDSPLLLIPFYEEQIIKTEIVKPAVFNFLEFSKTQGNSYINLWLDRPEKYDERGRWQTHEEAKDIDAKLRLWLKAHKVDFLDMPSGYDARIDFVLNILGLPRKERK